MQSVKPFVRTNTMRYMASVIDNGMIDSHTDQLIWHNVSRKNESTRNVRQVLHEEVWSVLDAQH